MKKLLAFIISFLAGLAIFFIIVLLGGWNNSFSLFASLWGKEGLFVLLLTFLGMAIGCWKWGQILEFKLVKVSLGELFRFYLAGFFLMFLFPFIVWGGEIFRGYVVKKKGYANFSKSISSVIIDRISEWTVMFGVVLAGVIIFVSTVGFPLRKLTLFLLIFFVFMCVSVLYFYFRLVKKESVTRALVKSIILKAPEKNSLIEEIDREIFNFFRLNNKKMWLVFLASGAKIFMMWARAWFLITVLGKKISLSGAVAVLGFTYLATMIPIPAALGVHEAAQFFVFNYWGLGNGTATAFAFAIRTSELIFAFLGLLFLSQMGFNWFTGDLAKKTNTVNFDNKN